MTSAGNRFFNIATLLSALAAAVVFSFAAPRAAHSTTYQFDDRITVVFPNGRVMFYSGQNRGLREGDIYGLFANDVRFGVVQIYRVDRFSSVAVVLHTERLLTEGRRYVFRLYSGPLEAGLAPHPPMKPIAGASAPPPAAKKVETKPETTAPMAVPSARRETAAREPAATPAREPATAQPAPAPAAAAATTRTSRQSATKTRRMAPSN